MPIEYLPNINVGSKIKLEQEKKNQLNLEKLLSFLNEQLAIKADYYNKIYGQDWLDEKARLRIPETQPDKESDQLLIDIQEQTWAQESGKSVEQWRQDKEKSPASLTEAALTLMLQRVLPDNFIVVRSSVYDDYNNGVDQLIIDRESGAVICGIDEVIDRQDNVGPSKKEEKIRQKMMRGGAKVKYGARVEGKNLVLDSLKNIPAFYLSLSPKELEILAENLQENEVSDYERDLLQRLHSSLSEQLASYSHLDLNQDLKIKLEDFFKSLEKWL